MTNCTVVIALGNRLIGHTSIQPGLLVLYYTTVKGPCNKDWQGTVSSLKASLRFPRRSGRKMGANT